MAKRTGILPHGLVSVSGVADAATREALRKLSENIVALAKEVERTRGGSR